jgi:hypothetical protein
MRYSTIEEGFIVLEFRQTQSVSRSKADHLRDKLANILDTNRNNIDVFSVQLRRRYPPVTDVRFSVHSSPYQDPVKLNGRVLMYREEVSRLTFNSRLLQRLWFKLVHFFRLGEGRQELQSP